MSLRSCEILLFLLFSEKLVTRRESTSLRSPAGNLLRAEFLSQPVSNTTPKNLQTATVLSVCNCNFMRNLLAQNKNKPKKSRQAFHEFISQNRFTPSLGEMFSFSPLSHLHLTGLVAFPSECFYPGLALIPFSYSLSFSYSLHSYTDTVTQGQVTHKIHPVAQFFSPDNLVQPFISQLRKLGSSGITFPAKVTQLNHGPAGRKLGFSDTQASPFPAHYFNFPLTSYNN